METKRSDCRPECYKQISDVSSSGALILKRLSKGIVGIKCTAKVTIGERSRLPFRHRVAGDHNSSVILLIKFVKLPLEAIGKLAGGRSS